MVCVCVCVLILNVCLWGLRVGDARVLRAEQDAACPPSFSTLLPWVETEP